MAEPLTRKEMYYSYPAGTTTDLPEPITREEIYLYNLCMNGGIGGGATPEQIEAAVNNYLDTHGITITDMDGGTF